MTRAAVVGAQYGSEGKGLIVGHIAKQFGHHVRVGAANAGHTVYTRHGWEHHGGTEIDYEKHVMQQIPCAAYANPDANLYVGPGALITPEIFKTELDLLNDWRVDRGMHPPMVFVDPRAHVIHRGQILAESVSDLQERIGSTSATAKEGIGAAQADRVMRQATCILAGDYFQDQDWWQQVVLQDVPTYLSLAKDVLLEGTQGTGLSLTTGNFPYVTSRNTTAAGLCADCGVPPQLDRIILVARTFPIRVAGNSGPFYADSKEISWESLGVNPENERTTVTKKVRRVATFSVEQIVEAVILNGASEIALTFCDYLSPRLAGVTDPGELDTDSDRRVFDLIDEIELATDATVTMLGTGPHSVIDL